MTTEKESTALAIANVMGSETPGGMVCSIKRESGNKEQAKIIYNAMNNPTYKLADFINKKIVVENVLIEAMDMVDEDTGEIDRVPRVVLIAPDGESYMSVSVGVLNAIKNLYLACGSAPWEGGLELEVKQINVKRGSMLTLEMV